MTDPHATSDQYEWLAQQLESLPFEIEVLSPSKWAEEKRYLPPSVTPQPGYYRFDVTPYLREIVDCLGVESPVRFVALMKGVQLGATSGVLENALGYLIEHVKNAPVMLMTAEAELASHRLEAHIIPMLQASGLEQCIKPTDEGNARKTGKTKTRLSWFGGGSLFLVGAKNANKLRSLPIQALLRDEVDAFADAVGKDGDPMQLSEARTNSYEANRKIVDTSTPLVKGHSKIEKRFALGDQRRYFVKCLSCRHPQVLRWRRQNPDTQELTGIVWTEAEGRVVPGSVRYVCEQCGHEHRESDKPRLIAHENAEWVPTAAPSQPGFRSYHISALYSLLFPWEACVHQWKRAWNDETNKPRDLEALQVFYNNILGEPYEVRGEQLRFERVSAHRRAAYHLGEIPNRFAVDYCLGPILLLVCTVDVHKDNLAVSVIGWAKERRAFLVEYTRFEGDTEQLDDPTTWGKLRDLIENQVFAADDGKRYRIAMTLIDSGYRADHVYQFCSEYERGVFPVKGRDEPKGAAIRQFAAFQTPMGTPAIGITVDYYKDRWSAALKQSWNGQDAQPQGHFNAPIDTTDAQLKELTVEVKREKIDKATGKRVGFEWYRPSGANNELWDLIVYASAALDVLAWDYCCGQLEEETVNWGQFYQAALEQTLYFEPG